MRPMSVCSARCAKTTRRCCKAAATFFISARSLKSYADTAALIANLDLVISVDTSVAHLAGALAKPVWILLPFIPDWRWLLDRDDSPWYPTARLFRQDETRGWDSVMARVHAALDNHLRRREFS